MAGLRCRVPARRVAAATALLAVAGLGSLTAATGALAAPSAPAAPKCTINFSSSDNSPTVGQNITLSWSAVGADQLVASWTSAHVPFVGSQVTTRSVPGPASYQVTGLKSGAYCGGAAVNVVFTAARQTSPAAPSSTAPGTSAASTSAVAASSGATATPTSSSAAVKYPAQSPTGGSGVPWYQRPADLVAIGVLSLLASVALYYREHYRGRLRAVLSRRH